MQPHSTFPSFAHTQIVFLESRRMIFHVGFVWSIYKHHVTLLQRRNQAGRAGERGGSVSVDRRNRKITTRPKRGRHRGRNHSPDKDVACTSTPTPAAPAASSLRERTAAGLLGELWDGQGECYSTNPRGEGARGFNGIHAIFIHPPPPTPTLVMTLLLLNAEEQLDWPHRRMSINTDLNALHEVLAVYSLQSQRRL